MAATVPLMIVLSRPYEHERDFERVSRFLIEVYEPGDVFANWLQPRWEYMHFHPLIWETERSRIGVFEEGGDIVGVVHFEHSPAFNYLQVRPGSQSIRPAMLDWAEEHLGGHSRTFERKVLAFYVNDFDSSLQGELRRRGFEKIEGYAEEHARFVSAGPVAAPRVPEGYRLQSLADENDLAKINRVLWRGFNHEGPPPDAEIPGREFAQSAPHYRRDLTIVAVAPSGEYAAFGGMWYVPENRMAYVEPVATDLDHRRRGLGAAVVLEGVRRVVAEGAAVVWVGSGQEFYKAVGFEVMFQSDLWVKEVNLPRPGGGGAQS